MKSSNSYSWTFLKCHCLCLQKNLWLICTNFLFRPKIWPREKHSIYVKWWLNDEDTFPWAVWFKKVSLVSCWFSELFDAPARRRNNRANKMTQPACGHQRAWLVRRSITAWTTTRENKFPSNNMNSMLHLVVLSLDFASFGSSSGLKYWGPLQSSKNTIKAQKITGRKLTPGEGSQWFDAVVRKPRRIPPWMVLNMWAHQVLFSMSPCTHKRGFQPLARLK